MSTLQQILFDAEETLIDTSIIHEAIAAENITSKKTRIESLTIEDLAQRQAMTVQYDPEDQYSSILLITLKAKSTQETIRIGEIPRIILPGATTIKVSKQSHIQTKTIYSRVAMGTINNNRQKITYWEENNAPIKEIFGMSYTTHMKRGNISRKQLNTIIQRIENTVKTNNLLTKTTAEFERQTYHPGSEPGEIDSVNIEYNHRTKVQKISLEFTLKRSTREYEKKVFNELEHWLVCCAEPIAGDWKITQGTVIRGENQQKQTTIFNTQPVRQEPIIIRGKYLEYQGVRYSAN